MNYKWPFLMVYTYRSTTIRTGRIKEGSVDAYCLSEAKEKLLPAGLKILSVNINIGASLKKLFKGSILNDDAILELFADFHRFLKAGLMINEVCDAIETSTTNKKIRKMIPEIKEQLLKGSPLSETLRRTRVFPELVISTLEAGEKSGALVRVCGFLSEYYKRKVQFNKDIQKAVFYPKIVLFFMSAAILFLSFYVVPKFQDAFKSFNMQLPLVTKIVLDTGDFINHWWWLVIIGGFVGFWWFRSTVSQENLEKFSCYLYGVPVIGNFLKDASFTVIFINYSVLQRSGISVSAGIDTIARTIPYPFIAKKLSYCKQRLDRGEPLSYAFKQDNFFPAHISMLLRKGEKTGDMVEAFEELGELYQTKMAESLDKFQKIVEPALLGVIGTVVALVWLAFFMVVYPGLNSISSQGGI